MPHSEPTTILLINDLGEEVKLVTLSFRGFFPGCRVEAVYSLDEALQWTPRADWHVILIDERLVAQRTTPILPELRNLAPRAALVLQTDRSDATAAVNALQAGADFLLYKKSPAFLTELMLYTKEALEKRELREVLERTQERHGRLVDTLVDVLYEVDAEGRFVYLSPSITTLLGYAPEELIGAPYSTLVPSDQLDRARHRFNDRRTGVRASRRIEIELVSKTLQEGQTPARIRAEISAKGLYDPQRRFLGTLGLLRDLSRDRVLEETIQRLERQVRETDRLSNMAQRLSTLSSRLQTPLAAVLSQSQQLLGAIQEARLDEHVTSLLQHATEAARQGEVLSQTVQAASEQQDTINNLLDAVLASTQPPLLQTDRIERQYGAHLPPFAGNRELTIQLFRTLINHAQRYVAAVGNYHRFTLSTALTAPAELEVRITETAAIAADQEAPHYDTPDLFHAYTLIQQLGGRLELLAPVGGLLSMTVWLPLRPETQTIPQPSTAGGPPGVLAPERPFSAIELSARPAEPSDSSSASTPALADRRQTARAAVHLPARVTIGDTVREGMVINLSPGGAGLEVEGVLPSLDQQPAYVILKTAVGMLELQATTLDYGVSPRHTHTDPLMSRLAFQFAPGRDVEQQILSSMIDEARERKLAVTVEALLSLPDSSPDLSSHEVDPDVRGTDHREAMRVRMTLPARIETSSLDHTSQRPLALVINLSRSGVCLQVKQLPGTQGDLIVLHFSALGSIGYPRTHEPEAPEAVLAAQIIWTAPDHTAPSELKPDPSAPAQRIGARFVQLTPFAEREINRVVAQHVGSSMDLEGIAGRSTIVCARRECRNARHQVIAITDDHARHQISPATPVVILAPGFGQTQTDYLPLSFFLAANRLRVLRYDHTNHVGQSDGDVLQTTLRGIEVDLQKVLEFARTTWPTAPLTILAEDVAARVALKVLSRSAQPGLLLLINPVLDLQTTLSSTYGHDVLADHRQGMRRGVTNLWGLNVNLDQFLSDAIAGEYADLASAVSDFSALPAAPTIFTTPKADGSIPASWEPSLRAFGTPPRVVTLQSALSRQSDGGDERHTAAFQPILKHMVAACSLEHHPAEIKEPSLRDIHRQQRLEYERIRIRHHVSQATREALWIAHLAQLPHLSTLHDYRLVEEELYRHLAPLQPDMTILDVGCGEGDLARVILTNQAYRLAHHRGPIGLPLRYIGVGQSQESLRIADQYVGTYAQELSAAVSTAGPVPRLLNTQWMQLDWNSALPFREQSVARIIFHLSLSFSRSPLHTIRQALQSLEAGGILLITCFQPRTDVSKLFRRHVRAGGDDEFTPVIQVVLHYLGRLREALRHGLLHTYERGALAQLLIHAGASPLRIHSILDGQLLLAVSRKGKSAG